MIEASNGVEAMEALEEKNGAVDLVVSDVVMPEMDGPTLLKEMRARNPNLRIIFVSGYAEDAFEKSLPENEQFAFLPKPFTLSAAGRRSEGDHDAVRRVGRSCLLAMTELPERPLNPSQGEYCHIPATEGRSRGSRYRLHF